MGLPAGTTITWYGHSCIRIDDRGRQDRARSTRGSPTRSSPMSADAVERCDLLLVTHGHFDHMGDAVALASRLRPVWPCMHEMSLWLARRLPGGADAAIGMNKGGTVEAAGLRVTMVGADHSAGDWNPGGETTLYLGDPAGFVIELEDGYRVYHAGDTQVFGDMALIRDLHRPDLAMLPIGGHFTMDPTAAALAVELLGVKDVVPLHYGTFPILTGTPDQLRAALVDRGLGDVTVHAPAPGGSLSPGCIRPNRRLWTPSARCFRAPVDTVAGADRCRLRRRGEERLTMEPPLRGLPRQSTSRCPRHTVR